MSIYDLSPQYRYVLPDFYNSSGQEQEAEGQRAGGQTVQAGEALPDCLILTSTITVTSRGARRKRSRNHLQCQTQQQALPGEGAATAAMTRATWKNDLSATSTSRTTATDQQSWW